MFLIIKLNNLRCLFENMCIFAECIKMKLF